MKLIQLNLFICFCLVLNLASVIHAKQSSINPWSNDPLAKINFEQNHPQKQEINKTNESSFKQTETNHKSSCKPLTNFCPVCETVEEWPIDFDGDDLAEKAQRRICQAIPLSAATKDIPESYIIPEIIIIYSCDGEPIIYKTTLNSCSKKTSFSTFQRFDFNSDNYDELILSERDLETNDEKINIISFFSDRISELPFVDFTPDLEEYISKEETSKLKKSFIKINGKAGFIMRASTPSGKSFEISYYQDSADRNFYPLKTILEKDLKNGKLLTSTRTTMLQPPQIINQKINQTESTELGNSFVIYETKR